MDLIEFVMAVECRFGLAISDEDATGITTPGKLIDYLCTRLPRASQAGPCLTQRAFYRVRQAFVSGLGTDREAVRPRTELAALVPGATRRLSWSALRDATRVREWPELCRPNWLFWTIFGFCVATGFGVLIPVSFRWGGLAVLVAAAASIFMGVLLARATVGFKTEFPPKATVRHLVRCVLAYTPIEDKQTGWTREQVASVVHALITEHFGIFKYTENSRWVEDMGFDD
jgi:hypothetical protein